MTSSAHSSGTFWKVFLALILVAFAVGMAISFRMAGSLDGKLSDRDYYEHGKHYDVRTARERKARELGWRLRVTREGGALVVTVSDKNGSLVRGGDLSFLPSDGAVSASTVPFDEVAPGRYLVSILALTGYTKGRLNFSSGDASLTTRISVVD